MQTKPTNFRTLIDDHLGGVSGTAEKLGVSEHAAKKMRDRRSIAFEHWPRLIELLRDDGVFLTDSDLREMREHKLIEKRRPVNADEAA